MSNTISRSGLLVANGGFSPANSGQAGRIRLEAYTISFTGSIQGTQSQSAPFPLLQLTAGPATAKVISIGGTPINPNPNTFPDITVNSVSALPVVIQAHNIPATATINLTILNQNGVADTVLQAPPIGNCDQNNVCTRMESSSLSKTMPSGRSC